MKREIVVINEERCTGCGLCIPNCHEGALQIIDGKARLISDLYCDGLGACIGHCPEGAMKIERKEVEAYDERKVMIDNIIPAGMNTVKAHLSHLRDHNAIEYYNSAVEVLKELNMENPLEEKKEAPVASFGGCPGSRAMSFPKSREEKKETGEVASQLTQWPVQLHLISPQAPYFRNSDLLLAADCTAFAVGDFHSKFLKNKSLAIACPKLDEGQNSYVEKLVHMIENAELNTITCMVMEVPCCGGLVNIARKAVALSKRKIPLKVVTVSIQGDILKEEWI